MTTLTRTRVPPIVVLGLFALACGSDPDGDGGDEIGEGFEGSGATDEDESADGSASSASEDGEGRGDTTASTGSEGTTATTEGGSEGQNWPKFDTLTTPDGGDGCGDADNDGFLTGTVYAPNGMIPVVGALVYTTGVEPEGIPDGVYCEECIELPCGTKVTETDIYGNFSLPVGSGAGQYLVVQKGQFKRIQSIDVAPGDTQLPDAQVELPGEWNPDAGLYIPRIAVADGTFDRIEDALGKFGLGDTSIDNFQETTIPGTESFDLYDNGRNPTTDGYLSQGNMGTLIADPDMLAKYHTIFVPCSGDTYSDAMGPTQIENIRSWVEAGGRWYVADWSNEFMSQVFPEYQNFYVDGDADLGSYDSLADTLDDGMTEWLMALPDGLKDINPLNDETHPTLYDLPQVMTVDNWSGIQYPLPEIFVDDGMGGQVNVGHKAWLEGPGGGFDIPVSEIHPLTVTGQYGCGKIQFTSYHTAEFFDYVGLSPQELVLLYTILEIGVCQENLPPPG